MSWRTRSVPLVGVAFVAGALLTSTVEASPEDVLGFGHRAIALGRTGAASAEGADAVHQNPALLALSGATSLQLGFEGAALALRADGPGMPGRVGATPFTASTLGAVVPLPFRGALQHRIALGLGVVTPTDVVVRARLLYPERPVFPLADRLQTVAVQTGVGVDVGHGVRLGGGVAALAALRGSVLVQTDATGRVGTLVDDTLVASYAPTAGASVDLGRDYRIGFAFRGELVARFDVVIRASDLGSLVIPPLHISGIAQYDPWQLALEAARITGPWRAAVSVTYAHWSAYPGPAEATVRCTDAPDPGLDCAASVPTPPGYRPTFSPRIGIERRLEAGRGVELHLRGGYGFEPSPAPEQTGVENRFELARSVGSIGWGARFATLPVSLDGFAQLQFLHPREHRKAVADGAPEDAVVETSGHLFAAGIAVTARLR